MSKFTDFLNLFMWDSIEDSEEEFNIDKALNDNWKKIDTKVKTHVTSVNEEINNFKEETNQKIKNIQALPTGGTKGQVLTKQSETNGDANWEDIEANEVFVGNEKEAPSSAKIIVEEDDFVEGSTLGKAEVYVGAEEPTTGEKVWFRKGKNLFNKNVSIITGYYLDNKGSLVSKEGSWYQNVFIEVNSKTQYTISSTVAVLRICFYDKDRKFISRVATENTSVTFSTPENCKYVRLSGENADTQVQSLQLEQGSKATSYEAYIEPKIYVRNSNGVYEEFAKKSEEVYSTEEQRIGTWIDGKPLYRKVLSLTTPSTTNSTKIANFDKTFIIKNYYGNAFISASNQLLPINFYFTDVYKIATYVVNNSGEIYMKIGSEAYRNQQATLTIEYTKTTD